MREILFRGQTRRHGEKVRVGDGQKLPSNWVYGGIFPGAGDFSIIYGGNSETLEITTLDKHVVYSDTVGQYTGLKDKNGNRIFEGDIIRAWNGQCGEVKWGHHVNAEYGLDTYGWFVLIDDCATTLDNDWHGHEVIDNIHDNPELLGGGDGG